MDEEHNFSDEEDYNSDLDTMDEVDTEKEAITSKDSKRSEKDKKKKEEGDDNEDEEEEEGDDIEEEEEIEENIEDDEDDDDDIENTEDDVILDEGTSDDLVEYIVKEEDRITSDCLSKYEMIELINIRATQISKGDYPFTDVKNLRDPISMAKKEIYDNKCPLLVKRGIGNNKFEVWNPNLMLKPKI
jgi:DNA-directed RNA polymerase subunit K/omega